MPSDFEQIAESEKRRAVDILMCKDTFTDEQARAKAEQLVTAIINSAVATIRDGAKRDKGEKSPNVRRVESRV